MFLASNILSFALEPLAWVLLFLLPAVLLLRRRPRLGRSLASTALAALLIGCWTFPPEVLLRQLEMRYPPLPASADMQAYAGVVVLGGALSRAKVWVEHDQVALNDQAERMTATVTLAQRYPKLKVIFTGGMAEIPAVGPTEAERARRFFTEMGLPPERVLYEAGSRTTYENAYFSAMVPGIDKTQRWLLLTSAFHMPRSMGVFEKVGWNVTPFPVDYRTTSKQSWYDFSFHDGPHTWGLALHEIVGYYAYRLSGRI